MKVLYLIGGTMGVGKTTVCRELNARLPNSVFLDGDWCWCMDPFRVNDETKAMVMDNICHLLNNFLNAPLSKTSSSAGLCMNRGYWMSCFPGWSWGTVMWRRIP